MFIEEIYPQYSIVLLKKEEVLPYPLLLLADETVKAIDKYVLDSNVYVLREADKELAVFCLYQVSETTVELKNIAVSSELQGKGIGSILIKEIISICKGEGYSHLIVGTADTGVDQIRFYERNGFVKYDVRKEFFLKNYDEPIIENGVQLVDMVMLEMKI